MVLVERHSYPFDVSFPEMTSEFQNFMVAFHELMYRCVKKKLTFWGRIWSSIFVLILLRWEENSYAFIRSLAEILL